MIFAYGLSAAGAQIVKPNFPPRFKTRCASAQASSGSATCNNAKLATTRSKLSSLNGRFCASPSRNSISGNIFCAFAKHERSDNSDDYEANDLDAHVGGGVVAGKTVPVPIRNIGCDRAQNSGDEHESEATHEAGDRRLGEQEDGENRFDNFGAELN